MAHRLTLDFMAVVSTASTVLATVGILALTPFIAGRVFPRPLPLATHAAMWLYAVLIAVVLGSGFVMLVVNFLKIL